VKRVAKLVAIAVLLAVASLLAAAAIFLHVPSYRSLISVGPEETIVIRNVRVFTATGTSTVEAARVVIEGGRISAIERLPGDVPPKGRVVDGTGKTLLPGLIDFHTHVASAPAPIWYIVVPSPEHNLEAYLYGGVTTVVSMGDDLDEIGGLRDRLDRGEIGGPRLLFAGSPITKTGGHPQAVVDAAVPWPLGKLMPDFSFEIDAPGDAEAAVDRMAGGGADLVKLVLDDLPPGVPKLSADHVRAIAEAAHRRGLRVAAHIGTAEDGVTAAASGVDLLNHGIHRGLVTPEEAEAIAATGVAVSPTLIVFERCAQFFEAKMSFDAMDREIESEEVLEQLSFEVISAHPADDFLRPWFQEVLASRENQKKNAFALHRAGVPIFVGTDSSILGNIAGSSIHEEMRLLVEAGLPPAEVLLGATARPAAFLFREPEIGTVEVGKVADLVLVDGNPLDDITATKRIAAVIRAGRFVERHTR
jgi:imidazolonepropionase-like amidohydrolase